MKAYDLEFEGQTIVIGTMRMEVVQSLPPATPEDAGREVYYNGNRYFCNGVQWITYSSADSALNLTTNFGGDVSGTYDSITVLDDSHNHIVDNIDGLATELSLKQNASTALNTSTTFSGDISGTYNNISVVDDSHNHIIGNVDGLQTALDSKVNSSLIGVANGVASLDAGGLIPTNQLPSYVDDVVEHTSYAALPVTGETGKIYVTLDTGNIYRWSGSAYVRISDSVATADEALKLTTARTISLNGDVTGSTTFDGSQGVTITATVIDDSHNHVISNVDNLQTTLDSKQNASTALNTSTQFGGDVSGTYNSIVIGNDSHTHTTAYITDANSSDVINTIVKRDGSGNFSANMITLTTALRSDEIRPTNSNQLVLNAGESSSYATSQTGENVYINAEAGLQINSSPDNWGSGWPGRYTATICDSSGLSSFPGIVSAPTFNGALTGNATTATTLKTSRTITLSGDVTGSTSFNGGTNVTITATVSDDSHNHVITNVDGLQTALDGKQAAGSYLTTTTAFSGDVSGTYNSIVVTDDSHNHVISNVDNLQTALDAKVNSSLLAVANGVATLDSGGKVPTSQLPSYVDDVVEVANYAALPVTGETGKIYVTIDTGDIYRWSGSAYVQINDAVSSADQATQLATARTISLTGDASGSTSFDGSQNVSITVAVVNDSHTHDARYYTESQTNTLLASKQDTLTALTTTTAFGGDISGTYDAMVVADDSHNHIIGNIDGLQSALDGKQAAGSYLTTTTAFSGDVSGTYNAIVVTDDSHNHIISNVDGLQTALNAKQNASTALTTTTTFSGDISGTYDAMVVADDSHNHIIGNIDGLQTALDGKQAAGTYNTIIGTDTDINTSGATIIDNIFVTDGVITSMGTRTLTAADLGALTSNQTITLSGDCSGSGTTSITVTVANDSHTHDTRYYTESEINTALAGKAIFAGRVVTDLNAYATSDSGFYGVSGTAANSPEGLYQVLINCNNIDVGMQLLGGYNSDDLWYRGWASSGATFYAWRRMLHDGNYNSYAPTLTGGGASGTWSISVTGSSSSCTGNAATATTASSCSGNSATATTASSCSGNSATATALATSRTISLTGDVSGSASFNGTANATITAVVANNSHTHTSANISDAASASTASVVVLRDGSGDINARLFRSEYDSTNGSIGYIMTQVDTASNNYIRPSTPAQFRAAVTDGIYAAASHSHSYMPLSGGTFSGAVNFGSNSISDIESITLDNQIISTGDTDTYMQFHAADQWRVVTAGAERIEVSTVFLASCEIRSTSNITAYYSDERLKDIMGPIDNAIDAVKSLTGFRYKNNDLAKSFGYTDEEVQIGISAQALQKVLPEAVKYAPFDREMNEDGSDYSKSGEDYLTIQYDKVVPLLIEAIKDQQKIIESLEARLDAANL